MFQQHHSFISAEWQEVDWFYMYNTPSHWSMLVPFYHLEYHQALTQNLESLAHKINIHSFLLLTADECRS